jgi:hypothetical protein
VENCPPPWLYSEKKNNAEKIMLTLIAAPRELAWLLYTGSWLKSPHKKVQPYATEVIEYLNNYLQKNPDNWGSGNENILYLFRSICLWSWRTGDHTAIRCINDFLSATAHFEEPRDPGPLGLATAFLILSGRKNMNDLWYERAELMNEYKYHLELSALYKLLGNNKKSLYQLASFHTLRNRSLRFQLPETHPHLQKSLTADGNRQQQEENIMQTTDYADSQALIDALLNNGLLPL